MAGASAALTVSARRSRRLRLRVLVVRMWLAKALERLIFPLLVVVKRLAAARLVLILGIDWILLMLGGVDHGVGEHRAGFDHEIDVHVAALEPGRVFRARVGGDVRGQAVEDVAPQ